jgi:hypothetical protein
MPSRIRTLAETITSRCAWGSPIAFRGFPTIKTKGGNDSTRLSVFGHSRFAKRKGSRRFIETLSQTLCKERAAIKFLVEKATMN